MEHSRYPVSYWCPPPLSAHTAQYLDDIAAMGITLIPSPYFSGAPEEKEAALAFFAAAEARGMEVVLNDARLMFPAHTAKDAEGCAALDADAFREALHTVHAEYGSRPSVHCYYIGDEPDKRNYAAMCDAARIVREETGKEGYINLLPYYPRFLKNTGFRDYDVYLEDFLAKSGSKILSQDFYAQCLEGNVIHEDFWHVLQCQYDVAKKCGAEIWHTVLACKHFDRRPPEFADFRFQISMALCYGAKQISFFTLTAPPNSSPKETNFTEAPFDWFGEKTETYTALQKALKELHVRFGDKFMGLEPQRVTHFPIVPYTYQRPLPRMNVKPFTPNENIYSVSVVRGLPRQHVVISEFVEPATGESYVFIANANPKASVALSVTFENAREVRRYDALGREYTAVASPDGAPARLKNGCFWLSPGQGELHRIVR
ncbi:MAG: hypothetical protein IKL89_00945 [Clostridia bacterium]|nr:hypothetical protein [Clostridia bacterium]